MGRFQGDCCHKGPKYPLSRRSLRPFVWSVAVSLSEQAGQGCSLMANTSITRHNTSADVSTVELYLLLFLFYNYGFFLFKIILEMGIF
jgi:hypothetical protein